MLVVEDSTGSFIRIRANGWLGGGDYRRFEPQFERELERRPPPVTLLLDMRGFRGWTPAGLLRDLRWDVRNRSSFSRIAVLGDARWHEWITILGALLFRARTKFFGADDEERARAWLDERAAAPRKRDQP